MNTANGKRMDVFGERPPQDFGGVARKTHADSFPLLPEDPLCGVHSGSFGLQRTVEEFVHCGMPSHSALAIRLLPHSLYVFDRVLHFDAIR